MFLDFNSLLNAALVNKRWSKVIGKSQQLMERFSLIVNSYEGPVNKALKTFQRDYQFVTFIENYKQIPKYLTEALKKIGRHVKTVSYRGTGIGGILGYSNLETLLSCFPGVENIDLFSYHNHADQKLSGPMLANLKSLKLEDCKNVRKTETFVKISAYLITFQMLHYFTGAQLIELEMENCFNQPLQVVEFISSQFRLTKLKLPWMNLTEELEFSPIMSQVHVLKLAGFSGATDKEREFANLFSSSVVDLAIDGSSREDFQLLHVMEDFKSLQKLDLRNLVLLHKHDDNFNSNITTLKLNNIYFHDSTIFSEFFTNFTKVKHLHLHFEEFIGPINFSDFRDVTNNMKEVETLTITGRFSIFQFVSFENLRSVEILDFNAAEKVDWARFINNNAKLETMHIEIKGQVNKFDFINLLDGVRNSMTVKISEKPLPAAGFFKLNLK
jgi:hypothetical protein